MNPKASGLLKGSGGLGRRKRRRRGKLPHFPDAPLTDTATIKNEIPDFDPELEFEYSQRELILLAERILLMDSKPMGETPAWLNMPALRVRQKREIYMARGIPEPHIVSGLYWRTHPDGRKLNSGPASSYYKN